MYAVSICPEFIERRILKLVFCLNKRTVFFLLTDSLKINLVSIFSSYRNSILMPCVPSTIDAAPRLRDIIEKTIQFNFISYFLGTSIVWLR